ncbi:tryptophan-rich sensory protein [Sinomonas notoginsengisoli]|uniref:tryptophan-rich sensory protein n=1 Tax=Sinomonas notoginsengisoli TaxID=1457311 RepID=UPI001F3F7454|nr:tryptophan-rich sensory protein [Sinomonas notoginsengisoli]
MEHSDVRPEAARRRHLIPAALTAFAAVAALVLATFGSGAFGGTRVQDTGGGYLSATATPVAPAAAAFAVWSVIYAGLLAYAIWQPLAAARASERQRRVRPWAAASMLLNAAWLWASQIPVPAIALPATLAVMLVLLAVLCRMVVLHRSSPAGSGAEALLSDGTFGLYLGWISVATMANLAALLGWALGVRPGDPAPVLPGALPAEALAVVVLAAATALGLALGVRGHWVPPLGIAWGLAWIAAGRIAGPLEMPSVGAAAAAAAVVVLGAGALGLRRPRLRLRTSSREAHA